MKRLLIVLVGLVLFSSFASAAPTEGEFQGKVSSVQYLDAQKEENDRYDLAIVTVKNFQEKELAFVFTRDTKIKSPDWGDAHLVYVQKGMIIKVDYASGEGKKLIARTVYVKKE